LLDRKAILVDLLTGVDAGILLNEHIDQDGALVFAGLQASGRGSKRVDSVYRSEPHDAWIKTKYPAAVAAQRERSENWNRWFIFRPKWHR
jgi:hypothetical protein